MGFCLFGGWENISLNKIEMNLETELQLTTTGELLSQKKTKSNHYSGAWISHHQEIKTKKMRCWNYCILFVRGVVSYSNQDKNSDLGFGQYCWLCYAPPIRKFGILFTLKCEWSRSCKVHIQIIHVLEIGKLSWFTMNC